MFLKSRSSTGWQVFWALRSTGLGKGGTRWGTWRKLCKKSWLAWPANSCLTIYAGPGEEIREIMRMTRRKAELQAMKGETSRQDTCIMVVVTRKRENDAKLCESIWKASEPLFPLDLKWNIAICWSGNGKKNFERGGGSTILFPMQMIYDELPAWWSREAGNRW